MRGLFLLFAFLLLSGEGEDTGRRRSRFDPAQFGVLKTLYPQVGWIQSVDVSADGRFLACGGVKGGFSVLRTKDWSVVRIETLPVGNISSLTFSPQSHSFAICGLTSNQIYIIDVEQRGEALILEGRETAFHSLQWSPDGQRLFSAGKNGAVQIWDMTSGRTERILREHKGEVTSLALDRDGETLFTGGQDGTIRIYETKNWKRKGLLQNQGRSVQHLYPSLNGKFLYGVTFGGRAELCSWDVKSEKRISSVKMEAGERISGLQMDPSLRYILLAIGTDIRVFRRDPLQVVETYKYHRSSIQALGHSSRLGWFVSGGMGSQVVVWGRVVGGMSAVSPRGFFGVQVRDAGNLLGASVSAVIPDTAASRVGIQVNDIISRVGKYEVHDTATAIAAIGIHSAGSKVSFTILREAKKISITVTLGKRPEDVDP